MRSGFCGIDANTASPDRCRMAGCTCGHHVQPETTEDARTSTTASPELAPGLYADMADEDYFALRGMLSQTGAKRLLPPSCPAKYRAWRDGESDEKSAAMDFGSVVHKIVLGKGKSFAVRPDEFDSWRTKDAKAFAEDARAEGRIPITPEDYAEANKVAAKVLAHPIAGPLFNRPGDAEVTAIWIDPETGVKCCARFDFLPEKVEGRRLIVPDLKTAISTEPDEFGRHIAKYGYALQRTFYTQALQVLGIDDDPEFVFVAVEKDAPYCVTVGYLSEQDKLLGRGLAAHARYLYRECMATDDWPEYATEVVEFTTPAYHQIKIGDYLRDNA